MNPPKTPATPRLSLPPLLAALALLLSSTACSSLPLRPLPVTAEDNTARLARHPQFQAAAQAAPAFVLDTFEVITRLERDKANRSP
jgi:hypothetical protein